MYSEIAQNKRKTFYIMFAFVLLVAGLGWIASEYFVGSSSLMPFILAGSLLYVVISYFTGAKTALAVNGAQEISKQDNPRLWRIVENLAITEGLPMPKVYIMNDPALNAFATGRDPRHAAVCATTGILEALNDTELEGVMAHELGHVKNYDIRVSMIAFALVVVIGFIADMMLHFTFFRDNDDNNSGNALLFVFGIIAGILAPLVASLIQLAISRRREYLADATGALATRYPEGLASALEKISQGGSTLRRQNSSTAHLFFANPLSKGAIASLFSTHPPIEQRIARLRKMGRSA
jgi:heat shock protein HtpX